MAWAGHWTTKSRELDGRPDPDSDTQARSGSPTAGEAAKAGATGIDVVVEVLVELTEVFDGEVVTVAGGSVP